MKDFNEKKYLFGLLGVMILSFFMLAFGRVGDQMGWWEGKSSNNLNVLIIPTIIIFGIAYHNRNTQTSLFYWNKYGSIIITAAIPIILISFALIIEYSDDQMKCVSEYMNTDSGETKFYKTEDIRAGNECVPLGDGKCPVGCEEAHPTQGDFLTSSKMLVLYCLLTIGCFIGYEEGRKEGKAAGTLAIVSFLAVFGVIISIAIFILNIGDPISFDQNVSGEAAILEAGYEISTEARKNYWFKGGVSDPLKLQSITVKKGDDGKKKLVNGPDDVESEECPEVARSGDSNNFLWKCRYKTNNRYEPKCMGDWWISSSKGGYEDEFKSLYRSFYILITLILVIMSLIPSFNKQSGLQGKKYIAGVFACIIIYLIVYHISNIIVSWTYNSPVLFELFISEYMKGLEGGWTDSNNNHTQSIWDNPSVASKFKIIIHVIVFILLILLLSTWIGQRFILVQVEADFGGISGKIFSNVLGILSSLIILLAIYGVYSTILVDKCVINRISESLGKGPGCQSIIKDEQENQERCEQLGENECKEDTDCEYIDSSFDIQELFRCYLDGHGGLLYHLLLIMIPLIFVIIKNSRFINYIM